MRHEEQIKTHSAGLVIQTTIMQFPPISAQPQAADPDAEPEADTIDGFVMGEVLGTLGTFLSASHSKGAHNDEYFLLFKSVVIWQCRNRGWDEAKLNRCAVSVWKKFCTASESYVSMDEFHKQYVIKHAEELIPLWEIFLKYEDSQHRDFVVTAPCLLFYTKDILKMISARADRKQQRQDSAQAGQPSHRSLRSESVGIILNGHQAELYIEPLFVIYKEEEMSPEEFVVVCDGTSPLAWEHTIRTFDGVKTGRFVIEWLNKRYEEELKRQSNSDREQGLSMLITTGQRSVAALAKDRVTDDWADPANVYKPDQAQRRPVLPSHLANALMGQHAIAHTFVSPSQSAGLPYQKHVLEWEKGSSGEHGSAPYAKLSEDELGGFEICDLKDMTPDKISAGRYPGGLLLGFGHVIVKDTEEAIMHATCSRFHTGVEITQPPDEHSDGFGNCKSCLQTVGLVWRLGMQASVVDATDTRDFTIFGEHAANILGYSEKEIGSLKQNDPVQYKALLQEVNYTPVVVRVKLTVRRGDFGLDIHVALLSILSLKFWESGSKVYEQEVAENNPDLTDEVAIRVAMTKAKNEAANAAAAAAASVGTTAKTPV